MIDEHPAFAALPAQDMERARAFWEGTVGAKVRRVMPGGVLYDTAEGSGFFIFPSQGTASGTHTQVSFWVTDLEKEVAVLQERGVVFEEYDYPTLKTIDGIAEMGGGAGLAAWFKDSEGNLVGMFQYLLDD